jgi:predicted phage replisome organizer
MIKTENRRYYWLKLKDDFFKDKKIKKLRQLAGGDTYTIIYLKLQLLSIKDEGILYFDNVEDTFIEELALEIDESVEDVKVCVMYLIKCGLIEEVSENEMLLIQARDSIGSETRNAESMRKLREKRKQENVTMLQDVTKSYLEKEIEKEKDIDIPIKDILSTQSKQTKHKYGEYKNVLLTDKELQSLKSDYDNCDELIKYLDEYIEMKGYKAKSHYLCIKKWVVNAVKEHSINKKEDDFWNE